MTTSAVEMRSAPAEAVPSTDLADHLRSRASTYFSEFANQAVEVRLVKRDARQVSVLHHFLLQSGEGSRDVLVKVPLAAPEDLRPLPAAAPEGRPRLALPLLPSERFGREFRTLAAIQDHFDGLGDPRFGAVRVLDLLPDRQAFIMEMVEGVSLRHLLYRHARLGGGAGAGRRLETAFHHTGAWLRMYHNLRPALPVEPRHTTRPDYEQFVRGVSSFLGRRVGPENFFDGVGAALGSRACTELPEDLPLGVGHGDFALRNILVGSEERVTVLDTVSRFLTPIYEDIGYFLVSLRYNWPQILTFGAAFPAGRLAACERAFLAGYFGDSAIPTSAIRLYELLALLDLWAAVASRVESRQYGVRRAGGYVQRRMLSRYLRQRVAEATGL